MSFSSFPGPMLEKGSLPATFLADSAAAANLREGESPRAGQYAAAVMQAVAARAGQDVAANLWCSSGLRWEVFVDAAEVEQLVAKHVSTSIH